MTPAEVLAAKDWILSALKVILTMHAITTVALTRADRLDIDALTQPTCMVSSVHTSYELVTCIQSALRQVRNRLLDKLSRNLAYPEKSSL